MHLKWILYLKSASSIQWLIVDAQGNVIHPPTQDEAASAYTDKAEVYAIVPGYDVYLTKIKIPALSSSLLLKAIPNILEDELADDISTLHFAIGKSSKGNDLTVAVVSQNKMIEWIDIIKRFLKTEQIHLIKMIPDNLTLPYMDSEWTLFIEESLCMIRMGNESGLTIEKNELDTVTKMLLKTTSAFLPSRVVLMSQEKFVAANELNFLQALSIPIEIKQTERFLNVALPQLDNTSLNLMQGAFKPLILPFKKLLYGGVILIISILLTVTFADTLQLILLTKQTHYLNKVILTDAQQIIPNMYPDAIRSTLKNELQTLETLNRENSFLNIVDIISPHLVNNPHVLLLGLDYVNQQLTLHLEGADFTVLEKLQKEINKSTVQASLSPATRINDKITVDLIIREK